MLLVTSLELATGVAMLLVTPLELAADAADAAAGALADAGRRPGRNRIAGRTGAATLAGAGGTWAGTAGPEGATDGGALAEVVLVDAPTGVAIVAALGIPIFGDAIAGPAIGGAAAALTGVAIIAKLAGAATGDALTGITATLAAASRGNVTGAAGAGGGRSRGEVDACTGSVVSSAAEGGVGSVSRAMKSAPRPTRSGCSSRSSTFRRVQEVIRRLPG